MIARLGLRALLVAITAAGLPSSLEAEEAPEAPHLRTEGYGFDLDDRIVSTYVFHWFTADDGQRRGPWQPLEGRAAWTGEPDAWRALVQQIMAANIDVIYVHLIDQFEPQRLHLFTALAQLREDGFDVPKLAPFFDPEVTWHDDPPLDLSTKAGKDAFVEQYVRFYEQYFAANPDRHSDSYLAQIDGRIVLSCWHAYRKCRRLDALSRADLENRLADAFTEPHPIFAKGVYLVTLPAQRLPDGSSTVFAFADERVHQFDDTSHYLRLATHRGVRTAQIKPGYWDQNVRAPGSFLPREGARHYRAAWDEILRDQVQRVYVESFNEYDEGTGIFAADVRERPTRLTPDAAAQNDDWSATNNPWEYIRATAEGAARFNRRRDLDARSLWHDIPERMRAGERRTVRVAMRNTGDTGWTPEAGFALDVERVDADRTAAFTARAGIPDDSEPVTKYGSVFRGCPLTFHLKLGAPTSTGKYELRLRMVDGRNHGFGERVRAHVHVMP